MQNKAMTRSQGNGSVRRRIGDDRSTFANAGLALMLAAGAASAQSIWSGAVDGTWGDSAKWTGGVPNNSAASLTPTAASYTVTVDAVPANPYTNLTITNAPANTTTLAVNADGLKSNDGLITIGRNATVKVNTGGVMHYDGSDSTKTIVEIKDGGVWHVDGGSVLFTNLYPGVSALAKTKTISIGPAGSEGTLRISSGDFNFSTLDFGNTNRLAIQVGNGSGGTGRFEMTGGSAVMAASSGVLIGTVNGSYGELRMSGDASLIMTNAIWVGNSGGTGVVSLADNAYLEQVPIALRIGIGGSAGSRGMISVSNNATLKLGSGASYTCLGGQMTTRGGGTGIVSFADSASGLFNILYVGISAEAGNKGYGELNLSGGQVDIVNSMGAGYTRTATGSGYGLINISGGTLALLGNNGMNLGTRDATATGAVPAGQGVLNLSGDGLITTTTSQIYVGNLSDCVGMVNQTGGRFVINHTATARPMIIGRAGGEGTYRISGGTFSSRNWVLVGGATGDGGSGSQGLLEVTGGSFSVTNTIFVGQNGTGRVVIGPAGTFFASALTLSGATSTLRFECGPAGVGSCTVTGALTVGSGAKLEVDASLFEPDSTTELVLAQYGSRSAPFAAGDITLVTGSRSAEVIQTSNQIVLKVHGSGGTLVTIR